MSKVAVILADGFEEGEALVSIDILRRASLNVNILSLEETLFVSGSHNITVKADYLFKDSLGTLYQAIILPGGMPGAQNLAKNHDLIHFLKTHIKKNSLIGAICASPSLVLADQGLLENIHYTGYPDESLSYQRGIYKKEKSIVVDKNFITAKSLSYVIDFGLAIVTYLVSQAEAKKIAKAICFNGDNKKYFSLQGTL